MAAFATTVLAGSPAQAASKKIWCSAVKAKLTRTACELQKRRLQEYRQPTQNQRQVNFRSRTDEELGVRSLNGGANGSGGRGGNGGKS